MKNNAIFHLSSIHFDWRAFFMSLTSIWKKTKQQNWDEIRCFNKLRHSWFCLKSTCSVLPTGVEYGFYTTLISTDFTNWGHLLSCIRWRLVASSPPSLTSTAIECTTRPFKLFKLQLWQATQLTARNYLQNEHCVRAPAAALTPGTSKLNCWQWALVAEEQNPSCHSYRDGSCCRDGSCLLHSSSLVQAT